MTITSTIDQVCAWLNENVCPKASLKKPPGDRMRTDDGYAYERIHPHAFPLYLPTQEKLPPGVPCAFPSICVSLQEGRDGAMNRQMTLSLSFGAWSPGIHPEDWIGPTGAETEVFRASTEGWRELWNFVDLTVTAIESATYIGDVEVAEGVEFGPYVVEEAVADYCPMWFAWCRFSVRSTILRNNQEVLRFL